MDDIVDSKIEFEIEAPPEPILRRSTRLRRLPGGYTLFGSNECYALTIIGVDPSTVMEARGAEDAKQ